MLLDALIKVKSRQTDVVSLVAESCREKHDDSLGSFLKKIALDDCYKNILRLPEYQVRYLID